MQQRVFAGMLCSVASTILTNIGILMQKHSAHVERHRRSELAVGTVGQPERRFEVVELAGSVDVAVRPKAARSAAVAARESTRS